MSATEKPQPDPATKPAAKPADERERKAVEALIARQPVVSLAGLTLADGRRLDYRATCEYLPVFKGGHGEDRDDAQAAVFITAYEATGVTAAERPVCFAFNGGPGSASLWLHLGALGPRRVVVPDDGSAPHPPYALAENPLSWLAWADMVFIDPPHTGWSVAAGDEARKQLLGVDGDVAALTQVMIGWLTRHRRWGSSVYLAGESYGTTRAAALSDSLLSAGIGLQGVILVSCAMDLQSIFFSPRNDLPYATFLPAMAAVAQFHGCLKGTPGESPAAAMQAAEAFVHEDYLRALHQGARLDASARTRLARRMGELTGLDADWIEGQNLRIRDRRFFFELLRGRGLQVGRLDARGTAPVAAQRSDEFVFDPGIDAIAAPYTMASMAYFADALGMGDEQRPYRTIDLQTNKAWNWNRGESKGNAYCATSDDLSRALRRSPHLRVFVASGRYDLGTPYSASDWSLAQLDVPPSVMARVHHHYYDAGHMMYTRQADLEKLHADIGRWFAGAAPMDADGRA